MTAWTDPSDAGTLDLASGTVVTETHWDNMRRDLLYLGGATGLWTAFTPTLNQTVAVTVTVSYARYFVIGKLALVECRLIASTAGTGGTAITVGALPAAIAVKQWNGHTYPHGVFTLSKNAGTVYTGAAAAVSSSQFNFTTNASGDYLGVLPNITIGNLDVVSLSLMYEIA